MEDKYNNLKELLKKRDTLNDLKDILLEEDGEVSLTCSFDFLEDTKKLPDNMQEQLKAKTIHLINRELETLEINLQREFKKCVR